MLYSILFSNRILLTNLSMNGNMFISDNPLDPKNFGEIIEKVTVISEDGSEQSFSNMKIAINKDIPIEGKYSFVLFPASLDELRFLQNRSDIEYIAMMTETEL